MDRLKKKSNPPISIRAYRFAGALARPFSRYLIKSRLRRGKELPARVNERYGIAKLPRPPGRIVWVHAASVGETLAVLPLAGRILRDSNCRTILLTTGTVTSANMIASRGLPDLIHQFVPMDFKAYVSAFLDHWKPDMAIFVESEIWPNILLGLNERSIPAILVNGRMSPNSHGRWKSFSGSISHLLGQFSVIVAQSDDDAARLKELGAPDVYVSGNLKFDAPPPPVDLVALSNLRIQILDRPVWIAASTHPGEEDLIADAHEIARRSLPRLLTIIIPRHPERGAEIAVTMQRREIIVAQRSLDQPPEQDVEIYIADTLGEIGIFCTVSQIVFMGGSLVRHGGQNPIEPIKLGATVFHGPHTYNFKNIYNALDEAAASLTVHNPVELANTILELHTKRSFQKSMSEDSQQIIADFTGALGRTLAALRPFYPER